MTNKQVLNSWSVNNKHMLTYSLIAFLSLLICFGFRGPSDRFAQGSAIGLFLGFVVAGKAIDLLSGGDRNGDRK